MTTPRFAACRCAHGKTEHDTPGLAPQCTHAGCSCIQYRPVTPGITPPQRPAAVAPIRPEPDVAVRDQRAPTLEQVLAAGKRSDYARTVKLAEKIAVELHDLRGRLTDEREAAEEKRQREAEQEQALADVERLAAELAAAKAKLTGRTPPSGKSTTKTGTESCPDCGKTGLSNVGVHRSRAHGYRAAR